MQTIYVIMEGGIIHHVSGVPENCRIAVVDYDVSDDDVADDRVVHIKQSETATAPAYLNVIDPDVNDELCDVVQQSIDDHLSKEKV